MRPIRFLAKSSVAPILKSIGLAIVLCSASAQIAFAQNARSAAYLEQEAATTQAKEMAAFLQLPLFLEKTKMRDVRSAARALGLKRTKRGKIENSSGTQDTEDWEARLTHPVLGQVRLEVRFASCTKGQLGFLSTPNVYAIEIYARDLSAEKRAEISRVFLERWGAKPSGEPRKQGLHYSNVKKWTLDGLDEKQVPVGEFSSGFISFYPQRETGTALSMTQFSRCN